MAVFRLVEISDLDTTQAHFAFATVDSEVYLRFGLLNSDDTTLINSLIADGRVGFFESDAERAQVRILARNDVNNGLQVESVPSALSVGSDYEIRFTQSRPGQNVVPVTTPGPMGRRGSFWTTDDAFPLNPLTNDLHLFSAAVAEGLVWLDSDGTTDLTAAVGGDIAQYNGTAWVKRLNIPLGVTAATVPGPMGTRGSLWTTDDAFALNPLTNDLHLFSAAVAEGLVWLDSDGTTDLTAAVGGDIAQYNGTAWVKRLNIPLGVTAATVLTAMQAMTDTQKAQARTALGAAIVQPTTALSYSTRYNLNSANGSPRKCLYVPGSNYPVQIGKFLSNRVYQYKTTGTSATGSHTFISNVRGVDYNSNLQQVWGVPASSNYIYRYNTSFGSLSSTGYALNANNVHPRGMAHVANVDEVWVADYIDRLFYRHDDSDGSYIGTYPLNANNGSAGDMTYLHDIQEVWVLDLIDKNIYRYNTTGAFLGVFSLTSDNGDPQGIVYVPPTDKVWIPDAADNKIYVYNTTAAST